MTSLDPRLPQLVMSMGTSFYADQVVDKLANAGSANDKTEIAGAVADFLDELVWIGILWKTGDAYEVRARPRGVRLDELAHAGG